MKNTIRFLLSMILFIIISKISNAQWNLVDPTPTNNTLRGVQLVTSSIGYAVGDSGTIIKTTDGGKTWALQSSGITNDLSGLSFNDANTGTVVGSLGTILRTTNGGDDWSEQSNGTDYWLSSVSFIDPDHGISCGGYDNFFGIGIIKRTTNGGETWSTQTIGSGWIADVSYIDTNYAFAISNFQSSIILNSSDGGETWSEMDTLAYSYALSFINAEIGTDVGVGGFISRTINGGANWTLQSSGIMKILYSVSFTDINYGTAVGDSGIILRTTNGGEDWINQSIGVTANLHSVSFVDENNGLVVGSNGTILRTTNGGVTFIDEEKNDFTPNGFKLSQNYPNPFNPSTTIRYSLPEMNFVTLKVYDILGSEVATLVNEEKSSGSYEVDFNAAGLSSGMYFYTLKAGNYVETKKMLLLK